MTYDTIRRMRPVPSVEESATFASRLTFLVRIKQEELSTLGGDRNETSINELARKAKMKQGHLSRYMTGKRGKRLRDPVIVQRLATLLGANYQWLETGRSDDGRVWAEDLTITQRLELSAARIEQALSPSARRRIESSPPPASGTAGPNIPPNPPPRHLSPVGGRKRPTK